MCLCMAGNILTDSVPPTCPTYKCPLCPNAWKSWLTVFLLPLLHTCWTKIAEDGERLWSPVQQQNNDDDDGGLS